MTMIMLLIFTIAGMFIGKPRPTSSFSGRFAPGSPEDRDGPGLHFCVFIGDGAGIRIYHPTDGTQPVRRVRTDRHADHERRPRGAAVRALAMVVVTILVAFRARLSLWLLRRG
jgi:hypothetical protein